MTTNTKNITYHRTARANEYLNKVNKGRLLKKLLRLLMNLGQYLIPADNQRCLLTRLLARLQRRGTQLRTRRGLTLFVTTGTRMTVRAKDVRSVPAIKRNANNGTNSNTLGHCQSALNVRHFRGNASLIFHYQGQSTQYFTQYAEFVTTVLFRLVNRKFGNYERTGSPFDWLRYLRKSIATSFHQHIQSHLRG